jgi:iron complex outermembrane receptor protein
MKNIYLFVLSLAISASIYAQDDHDHDHDHDFSEEVIVSSVGERQANEIISSTYNVPHELLDRAINSNLGNIIENVVGVNSSNFGRGVGKPQIRGLGEYRVKVLENDLASGDMADNGADHPHAFNVLAFSRIEVLKGPAALRYGPFSSSGVINMLSEHKLIDENTPSFGDIIYGNSSVADENSIHFHSLHRSGNWFWGLSGNKRNGKDYKIPGFMETEALHAKHEDEGETDTRVSGAAKNTALKEDGINFHNTWLSNNKKLTYFINRNEAEFGIPGHEHEEEKGKEEVMTLDMDRTRYGVEYTQNLNGFFNKFSFNSAFIDYQHAELEGNKKVSIFTNDSNNIRIELAFDGNNALPDQEDHPLSFNGVIGFSSEKNKTRIAGEEAGYIPSFDQSSEGLYFIHNIEHSNLLFEVAARLENNKLNPNAIKLKEKNKNNSNYSIGSGLKLSDNTLIGVSISKNSRAPSISEIYAEGVHHDAGIYEKGNSLLKNEDSISKEIYYRYSNSLFNLNAAYFSNDFDSFIYRHITNLKVGKIPVIEYRQQGSKVSGTELEISFDNMTLGNYIVSHSFMISKINGKLNDGGYIPRMPPLSFQYTLDAMSDNWLYTLRYRHSNKQDSLAYNEMLTDAYNRLDLEVGYRASNNIFFILLMRNIGDKDIRNHTSWLKDKLPEPGRDYNLSVQYSFR